MTGNCLKGSRPIMSFDKTFDTQPHLKLLKEMILQVFGCPRNHPKSKPFIDHVFSWFVLDGRVWFRNYQVCLHVRTGRATCHSMTILCMWSIMQIVYDDSTKEKTAGEPVLVEVGPRLVLNPIKIFRYFLTSGCFSCWSKCSCCLPCPVCLS